MDAFLSNGPIPDVYVVYTDVVGVLYVHVCAYVCVHMHVHVLVYI